LFPCVVRCHVAATITGLSGYRCAWAEDSDLVADFASQTIEIAMACVSTVLNLVDMKS
jgi:hypothetical protein